jgi:uncharacterized protein (DUF4213/DUF364 family)
LSKAIVEEALACLSAEVPNLQDITVSKACLGWGYVGVELSTDDVGVCHSLVGEAQLECCQVLQQAGTLSGTSAIKLGQLAKSWDHGERVIGVATINAMSQIVLKQQQRQYSVLEGNTLDHVDIQPGESVAMVGNIKPLVPAIRNRTTEFRVFERGGSLEDGVLPDTAAEEMIPEANVVLITGSAIANGTIGRLLELAARARSVIVVGPSASMIPDPLFKRGVDLIGGIIVTDPDRAMQVVAEGGGTPQLKAATRFVIIKPRSPSEPQRSST